MDYPWQVADFYRQFNPRWFDSVDQYEPNREHLSVFYQLFARTAWSIRRDGMWYVARPPQHEIPEQGWKIHISARTADSVDVLTDSLEVLLQQSVSFKFLLDRKIAGLVNSKTFSRGSFGKFVTIYPQLSTNSLKLENNSPNGFKGSMARTFCQTEGGEVREASFTDMVDSLLNQYCKRTGPPNSQSRRLLGRS